MGGGGWGDGVGLWSRRGGERGRRERDMAGGFGTWREAAEGMKREEAALRRGLMRMAQGKMGMCLTTWREAAAEMKQQKGALSGGVQRMLHRALSRGLETWQANAADGKEAERLLTVLLEPKELRSVLAHP